MTKKTITVLLPTCNRKEMLETALRSIAIQTHRDCIAKVLVIENGLCAGSRLVCEKFSDLPIHYVFHDPPLAVGYPSAIEALKFIETEHLAILFDDDWWMPDHLANSISAIESEPNLVASYSSYVTIAGEHGYVNGTGNSFLNWFAARSGLSNDRWIFDLEDLLVANLVATTGLYMTLLVKRKILEKCLPCISHGNPYDTDRLLAVELGRHGKVVFTRRPTVYVRIHRGQESHRLQNSGEALHWWHDSTEKLISLACTQQIDLRNAFSSRLHSKSVDISTLHRFAHHDAIEHLSSLGILPAQPLQSPTVASSPRSITSRLYRSIFPPLLQTTIDRMRQSTIRQK